MWLDWLMTHASWGSVASGIVLIASVANLLTSHYGETNPRLKKALLFIVDLLAIVVSRGSTDGPGRLGGLYRMKLPMVQVSPKPASATQKTKGKDAIFVVVAVLLLTSCAGWKDVAFRGLDSVSSSAVYAPRAMHIVCENAKTKCIEAQDRACAALQKCDRDEKIVAKATVSAHGMALVGLSAVEVGDKPTANKAFAEAVKLLEPARAILKAYGVTLP